MEKIQMTEEQARRDFRKIIPFNFIMTIDTDPFFESFITNLKNAGFIKKSAWDEAEEMYREFNEFRHYEVYSGDRIREIVDKLYLAIQELLEAKK
jgi:hypothetical protein